MLQYMTPSTLKAMLDDLKENLADVSREYKQTKSITEKGKLSQEYHELRKMIGAIESQYQLLTGEAI